MNLITRLFTPPAQSFFLFGPRGTGKSTWLRMHFKNAIWLDLLNPVMARSVIARPERLYEMIEADSKNRCVIIDEIQRAPSLLTVVHDVIEKTRNIQFVLTGSSARKLKRTHADLLGGRALKRQLHPFIAAELKKDFNFKSALQFGTLPLVYEKTEPNETLHAYIHLYLQEEIQAEGLVRNVENFARFLEVVSFSHGAILNITNIARECEVKRKTVENYLIILEDLLLAYRIPVFTKRAQRGLTDHPKFYLFDAGVFHALRPQGPLDSVDEIAGSALEGLVAHHLIAWNDYSQEKSSIYFWRTRSGVEVDFIVYGRKEIWAIEVKNSKKVSSQDTRGLETFLQDYPMAKTLLLYRGEERLKIGNVLCIPCEKFLLQLQPDNPLWK